MSPAVAITKSPGCGLSDVSAGGVGLLFIHPFFAASAYNGWTFMSRLDLRLRVVSGFTGGGFVGSSVHW